MDVYLIEWMMLQERFTLWPITLFRTSLLVTPFETSNGRSTILFLFFLHTPNLFLFSTTQGIYQERLFVIAETTLIQSSRMFTYLFIKPIRLFQNVNQLLFIIDIDISIKTNLFK